MKFMGGLFKAEIEAEKKPKEALTDEQKLERLEKKLAYERAEQAIRDEDHRLRKIAEVEHNQKLHETRLTEIKLKAEFYEHENKTLKLEAEHHKLREKAILAHDSYWNIYSRHYA